MYRRILASCLLCILLLAAVCGCSAHEHSFTRTVIPPTCNSLGYTINTCSCSYTYYSDYQSETPHLYEDWRAGEKIATLTEEGEEYRVCKDCGALETRKTQNLSALPKLMLTGVGASDGWQEALLSYQNGEQLQFTCTVGLKKTTGSGKPTYDLVLYASEYAGETPDTDLGWGALSRYRLSALSPDGTFSRALAAESLWRSCLPMGTGMETDRVCASQIVGSHIVQVYTDGKYQGLYALLPPEGTWFSALDGTSVAALYANDESDGCLFGSRPLYTSTEDGEGFRFLGCSTQDTAWAEKSFGSFSTFVRTAGNRIFKDGLSSYTDPEALIDYFLFLYLFGLPQGDTQGTVWYTVDGVHWLPSFYDLTYSYGLKQDGTVGDGTYGIPAQSEPGTVTYSGNNLLWQRLSTLYAEEIRARYVRLRAGALSKEQILSELQRHMARFEADLLPQERTLDETYSVKSADLTLIDAFLQKRLEKMDTWLLLE